MAVLLPHLPVGVAFLAVVAALAGEILCSRMRSGAPSEGQGWELNAITAVIAGGAGSALGALLGMLFIGVVSNGMILLNVSPIGQYWVKAPLILVAVWITQGREGLK